MTVLLNGMSRVVTLPGRVDSLTKTRERGQQSRYGVTKFSSASLNRGWNRVVLENNNEYLKQPSERHRTCPLAPLPVEAAPGCCRREVLAVPGAADG